MGQWIAQSQPDGFAALLYLFQIQYEDVHTTSHTLDGRRRWGRKNNLSLYDQQINE